LQSIVAIVLQSDTSIGLILSPLGTDKVQRC